MSSQPSNPNGNDRDDGAKPARKKGLSIGAAIAIVVAIATAVWVSNGNNGGNGTAVADSCPANPEVQTALDEKAIGDLAAVQVTAKGARYDEISFIHENGDEVGFSAFEGNVTLVNFWATWCAPCRAEMPELEALQKDYGDKGFTVATINLDIGDDGLAKAKKFMDEEDLSELPLHRDPTFEAFEVLKKRGVALGLPATLVLGPDGCEWGVLAGPAAWHGDDAKAFVEKALALAENS
ncbi:TlpA family protein disulfide reductase [Maritalea mediterranea]|uniref:TlpA family protein disulfide reductase n=1 Tax=Maritalea mediterranea TaxID=2909667 RepID=A0ABS9E964_9HYPH|nr:TlpA disulfide reductase family protein [Maritalea mediterranea]MCF4099413.1 TlpA family protein disulfide reductase [Maritalea mediterranea]